MKLKPFLLILSVATLARPGLFAEIGDDNPTGVAGSFNGEITTGGMYDGYTANARRVVDDIVVPGSVGSHPLKWTRYWNSHSTYSDNRVGGYWRYSYFDFKYQPSWAQCTPEGSEMNFASGDTYGVEDFSDGTHLADGTQVTYYASGNIQYPQQIIDPYGQITTLTWSVAGSVLRLAKVTEPGGRYLQINWDTTNTYITSVQAFDGIVGHTTPTQWVNYTWATQTLTLSDGSHPNSYNVL